MADISKIKLPDGNTYDVKDTSKSSATNWVNGSQDGSVRTVTSAVESSSYTIGSYAITEGYNTKASGYSAHAEGYNSVASGEFSHVEGYSTTASNSKDHAEGYQTTASGGCAHAEGYGTTASGLDSHAEGDSTIANHLAQHVFGQYNIADTSTATAADRGKYIEIVGNGSYNARSNARTLDWSGNEVLAGKLTVGVAGTNSLDVATIGQLPTKTSDLTNDSGFITGYTETDPVFSASAAAGITATDISNWNNKSDFSGDYIDLINKPTIPTKNIWYATCNTAANVETKIATTTSGDFTLSDGNMVRILMTNGNTSVSAPTISIDGTTAKIIYYIKGSYSNHKWVAGEVIDLVYDEASSRLIMLEGGVASTTDYGVTRLIDSVSSTSTVTAATPNAVKQAYDNGGVQSVNGNTGAVILSIPSKTSDLTNDSGFITGYTETDPVFTASAAHGISTTDITNWNSKQTALVSGTNIKTVNNQSLLGSGNLTITGGSQVQIVRWTENLTTT